MSSANSLLVVAVLFISVVKFSATKISVAETARCKNLYLANKNGKELVILDVVSQDVTVVADLTTDGRKETNCLAAQGATGLLYGNTESDATGAGQLHVLNPLTGRSLVLGGAGVPAFNGSVAAIDIAADGTMYGLGTIYNTAGTGGVAGPLFRINTLSGKPTLIGNTNIQAFAMTLDHKEKNLVAIGVQTRRFYTINPQTAETKESRPIQGLPKEKIYNTIVPWYGKKRFLIGSWELGHASFYVVDKKLKASLLFDTPSLSQIVGGVRYCPAV